MCLSLGLVRPAGCASQSLLMHTLAMQLYGVCMSCLRKRWHEPHATCLATCQWRSACPGPCPAQHVLIVCRNQQPVTILQHMRICKCELPVQCEGMNAFAVVGIACMGLGKTGVALLPSPSAEPRQA